MDSIFEPSESINYNFVAVVYGCFSAFCLVLFGMHFYTPAVEGFFLTLLPFIPCFLWSLVVRNKWLAKQKTVDTSNRIDSSASAETKKEQ